MGEKIYVVGVSTYVKDPSASDPEIRLREMTNHSLLVLVVADKQKVSASASSSRMIAPLQRTPLLKSANPAAPCSAHK